MQTVGKTKKHTVENFAFSKLGFFKPSLKKVHQEKCPSSDPHHQKSPSVKNYPTAKVIGRQVAHQLSVISPAPLFQVHCKFSI